MRETGPVFVKLSGDRERAQSYLGLARTLLGRLKSRLAGASGAKTWTLRDGTVIRTTVAGNIDLIRVDSPPVTAGEPCPLVPMPPFHGIVVMPRSGDYPTGFGSSPIVVVKPKFDPTTELFEEYQRYFFDKDHLTPATPDPGKVIFYYDREYNKCGARVKWIRPPVMCGNISWRGPGKDGPVLSWVGVPSRYIDGVPIANIAAGVDAHVIDLSTVHWGMADVNTIYINFNPSTGGPWRNATIYTQGSSTPEIYYAGRPVEREDGSPLSIPLSPAAQASFASALGRKVSGACLIKAPTGERFLVFVSSILFRYFLGRYAEEQPDVAEVRLGPLEEYLFAAPVVRMSNNRLVVGEPEFLGTLPFSAPPNPKMFRLPDAPGDTQVYYESLDPLGENIGVVGPGVFAFEHPWFLDPAAFNLTPWFFNESGTEGVANRISQANRGGVNRARLVLSATNLGVSYSLVDDGAVYSETEFRFADYIGDLLVEFKVDQTARKLQIRYPGDFSFTDIHTLGGDEIFGGFLGIDLREDFVSFTLLSNPFPEDTPGLIINPDHQYDNPHATARVVAYHKGVKVLDLSKTVVYPQFFSTSAVRAGAPGAAGMEESTPFPYGDFSGEIFTPTGGRRSAYFSSSPSGAGTWGTTRNAVWVSSVLAARTTPNGAPGGIVDPNAGAYSTLEEDIVDFEGNAIRYNYFSGGVDADTILGLTGGDRPSVYNSIIQDDTRRPWRYAPMGEV